MPAKFALHGLWVQTDGRLCVFFFPSIDGDSRLKFLCNAFEKDIH